MFNKKNTPLMILGLFDTGLYAAQSIARYKIPVHGFDSNKNNPGFYSRHINSQIGPHPFFEPEHLLERMVEKAKEFTSKPVLISSSEDYLGFIAKYFNELTPWYSFIIPDQRVIQNILNKHGQFEMAQRSGLSISDHSCIKDIDALNDYLSMYKKEKIIIKALDQAAWKAKISEKAFISNNDQEIFKIGKFLLDMNISFIFQKVIEGNIENNYEYNALLIDGKIAESCVIQKLRQYPPYFGAASCIQTVQNNAVEELGQKFISQNRIDGFSNTEFKLNPADGKYYFIETNARVWQQIRLSEYNGQNFVLTYYNHLSSNHIESRRTKHNRSIKWVDIFSDYVLWWRYLRKNGLGFWSYLGSLTKTKNFGLLNLNDIGPFFHELRHLNLFKTSQKRN